MIKPNSFSFLIVAIPAAVAPPAVAVDWSGGVMAAVPVHGDRPPRVDGRLDDWDLSAAEPMMLSGSTAARFHAEWAAMYDDEALYLGIAASLPGRPYDNPNNPTDGFWWGDALQVRFAADPSMRYPLDRARDAGSDRVAHVSIWKNSETGEDFINIARGVKLNLGGEDNPEGSEVVLRPDGTRGYVAEVKLPWSVLGAPGGRNPFVPGQRMAFVAETLWKGGDTTRVAAVYRANPGTFAFQKPDTWGQLEFAPQGFDGRRRPTLASLVAGQASSGEPVSTTGVPFTVEVPGDGLVVSVNIMGANGEVLRELLGGRPHPQGPLTVYWDGRDAWGHALAPGGYRWGAYFHRPLSVEYVGSVGSSGNPPYSTLDGKGGWGGDHSNPIDCAADGSGLYFLWPVSEAGKAVVKTDYQGEVLWRKTPFVGGGFGPFGAIAVDGRSVYLTLGDEDVRLAKLDAATGRLMTWGDGGVTELPLGQVRPADGAVGHSFEHAPVGLAARDGLIFVSSFATGSILVVDADGGGVERELACERPRGLAFDAGGDLFVATAGGGNGGRVVRFDGAAGAGTTVVGDGLEAPFDIAVDPAGRIYVSDLGGSHQVKVFDASGAALQSFGRPGGRPWQGRYDPGAFLNPAGLAIGSDGALLVAESSPPKVISRLNPDDGRAVDRWYGPGVYWNSTWPMPEDPRSVFYTLPGAIGRARVRPDGEAGMPEAYWAPDKAGYPHVESLESGIPQPEVVRAENGDLYLVHDAADHAVLLLKDDVLRPVATWRPRGDDGGLHVWIDADGDGQPQASERSDLDRLADGEPAPRVADKTASMHMQPDGDLYFTTQDNSILKVPAAGFSHDGTIGWDTRAASLAVPEVLPGRRGMHTTYRHGLRGVRLASGGDIYVVFNTSVPGEGRAFDFVSGEVAEMQKDGLGHTSTFNVVKFARYDPAGRLVWMAGRKALAGAGAGEIYHSWNLAGLINDRYVASGSEWGTLSLYTHDGFFVGSLMNDPGDAALPGPYTFGGETSGARVHYFPDRDEVWAYSTGRAFRVHGFTMGVIDGERRAEGTLHLDRVYDAEGEVAGDPPPPLQMVRLEGRPHDDPAVWDGVPPGLLVRKEAPLATAQLGYDEARVYVRMHVVDPTPLANAADETALAIKGGDTAGIVLGAAEHDRAGEGDVRLMAALIGGEPRLVAMKAVTRLAEMPFEYVTHQKTYCEFVGEVPGGRVELTPDPDGGGYTAVFSVPRDFLEFEFEANGTLRGDVEIRLSGAGSRGLQVTERRYLFTPRRPETTMVDDVPTEARLYPQYWGEVEVK